MPNLTEHYLSVGMSLKKVCYLQTFSQDYTIIEKLYVPPLLPQISPSLSAY